MTTTSGNQQTAALKPTLLKTENKKTMTDFNFDELIERRGTYAMKWDEAADPDIIPMWVADMDFKTAPAIRQAVEAQAKHGIYGYTYVPAAYYEAICGWFEKRHNWRPDPSWILYTTSVIPALSAAIKANTNPGDKVVLSTPVYNCFFSSIRNNGCSVLECPLKYEDNNWTLDWATLEKAFSETGVKAYVLCNPHNPVGRVWTASELTQLAELANHYGVLVISDEIHGEFVFSDTPYTPFASLREHNPEKTVTLSASSKAFNTAGLKNAFIIAEDAKQRKKIDRALNINECCDVTSFGIAATIAAYTQSEAWLDALLSYLKENATATLRLFQKECPEVVFSKLEGTYLMWADCRFLGLPSQTIKEELLRHEKVWIHAGSNYGAAGEGFIRLNIATPRQRLLEGMSRVIAGIKRLEQGR